MEEKAVRITVTVPESIQVKAKAMAKRQKRSFSNMVSLLLSAQIEAIEQARDASVAAKSDGA